ncbi:hypothetical protein AC1031_021142 [Aphanomyces cochlioides]|nr:hypothetical protein AC1031_021142 [Aphanomyces cochlioides]
MLRRALTKRSVLSLSQAPQRSRSRAAPWLASARTTGYTRQATTRAANDPADRDDYSTGILALVVFCTIAHTVYSSMPSDEMRRLEHEGDSTKKLQADSLPGELGGDLPSGVRRVWFPKRLPLSVLATNGIEHARMGGTVWVEDETNAYFQQSYWNDEAAYDVQSADAKTLRDATFNLHAMCLKAVDMVANSEDLMDIFEIPLNLRGAVKESWARREKDLLGRFDFIWDGRGPPKLLEYNADTPTTLVETAVGQQLWAEEVLKTEKPGALCFNDTEDYLVKGWRRVVPEKQRVHLAGTNASVEESEHVNYMYRTAVKAGLDAIKVQVSSLEVDSEKGQLVDRTLPFYDADASPNIDIIWKLYPYEWLAEEVLGDQLFVNGKPTTKTTWIEPAWKLILGNKAILALLWQMYTNHPNLLPASYDEQDIKSKSAVRSSPSPSTTGKVLALSTLRTTRTRVISSRLPTKPQHWTLSMTTRTKINCTWGNPSTKRIIRPSGSVDDELSWDHGWCMVYPVAFAFEKMPRKRPTTTAALCRTALLEKIGPTTLYQLYLEPSQPSSSQHASGSGGHTGGGFSLWNCYHNYFGGAKEPSSSANAPPGASPTQDIKTNVRTKVRAYANTNRTTLRSRRFGGATSRTDPIADPHLEGAEEASKRDEPAVLAVAPQQEAVPVRSQVVSTIDTFSSGTVMETHSKCTYARR